MNDNLALYNALRVVPQTAQKEIQAGKLKGFTDINPMWRIKKLTELFGPCGFGWWYRITEQQILDACRKARCHDFISTLPESYDTVVGEGGATLSGGERQRISLARAFLKDVPILLLDEPTASLDADNEAAVQKALDEISKERTVIMIAHRLKTVRGAQQILVLENGRITQKGTHNQLVGTDGLYSRLWELQNQAGNYTFKQS